MSDLFAPLREPEPLSPLAPDEVRRAGDRRRRRRSSLVVAGSACAAAIVVGVATLGLPGSPGADGNRDPVDSPPASTLIPEELDLADGLPREALASGAADPPLGTCEESSSPSVPASASEAVGSYERGDIYARGLRVYPDEGTAATAAADLATAFERCTGARGTEWTTSVRSTSYGDEGWVLVRSPEGAPDDRTRTVEVVNVVRLGANVLVLQHREIHGMTPEELTRIASDQVDWLMRRQMCLLTDEGCAWRADPDVLRPDGWGPLRLGMSRDEVAAVRDAELGDGGSCIPVELGGVTGAISESDGLVRLEVPAGLTTPEGIGVGSDRNEVLEEYWFGELQGRSMLVRASPAADYEITLQDGHVVGLALKDTGKECSD